MALDFLRRDCAIMNDFFKKKRVPILTTQQFFNYVTDIVDITEENEVDALNDILHDQTGEAMTTEQADRDAVFEQIYIPRTLEELDMNDLEKMARNTDEVLFDKLTGMLPEGLDYLEKLVGKEF